MDRSTEGLALAGTTADTNASVDATQKPRKSIISFILPPSEISKAGHGETAPFGAIKSLRSRDSRGSAFWVCLKNFKQSRRAHAPADAHGGDDIFGAAALAFDQRMADEAGAATRPKCLKLPGRRPRWRA